MYSRESVQIIGGSTLSYFDLESRDVRLRGHIGSLIIVRVEVAFNVAALCRLEANQIGWANFAPR